MLGMRSIALAVMLVSSSLVAAQSDVADAAMRRDSAEVQRLLKAGADVNGGQSDGATALQWAAYHGDAELASALLKAGADAAAANRNGSTAMWLAASRGEAAVLEALLSHVSEIRLAGKPEHRLNNTLHALARVPVELIP